MTGSNVLMVSSYKISTGHTNIKIYCFPDKSPDNLSKSETLQRNLLWWERILTDKLTDAILFVLSKNFVY